MMIGDKVFDTKKHTYIMGILNITPDSFFDGDLFNTTDRALKQVEKMVEEGASIVDIGAQATHPGCELISQEEEINRIGDDLIYKIKQRFNIAISIDTEKPKVAEYALQQGADLVNDMTGLINDNMAEIVSKFDAAYCLTYNKKTKIVKNFLDDMLSQLKNNLETLTKTHKISADKIMVDGGIGGIGIKSIGYSKTKEEDVLIIKHTPDLLKLGFPVLVGASNKSFIGKILNKELNFRLNGTIATSAIAAILGAGFIRVHNVLPNLEAVKIADAIKMQI